MSLALLLLTPNFFPLRIHEFACQVVGERWAIVGGGDQGQGTEHDLKVVYVEMEEKWSIFSNALPGGVLVSRCTVLNEKLRQNYQNF